MTVQELIQQLLKCDSEAQVIFKFETSEHEYEYFEVEESLETTMFNNVRSNWVWFEDQGQSESNHYKLKPVVVLS